MLLAAAFEWHPEHSYSHKFSAKQHLFTNVVMLLRYFGPVIHPIMLLARRLYFYAKLSSSFTALGAVCQTKNPTVNPL